MLGYLDTKNLLFTRGVNFDINQYLFVLQVVLGEDMTTAYAMIYDAENFKKETAGEDEAEYLSKFEGAAHVLLHQQESVHLREYLEELYQSDIQSKASTLKDYKFSGSDIQQLLANLLHNRTGNGDNLDDASVRDIISLIKTMYEQGALDSGDSFSKHFIQIHEKFNALCVNCNHELDVYAGVNCRCPHCGQVYKWSETENRFYPQATKL